MSIQDLNVLYAVDRAGLVGADGPTHAGSFDLSFMRCLPNTVIMTPSDENECYHMISNLICCPHTKNEVRSKFLFCGKYPQFCS